jgi:uncharacterized protein YutE (UPF0331/DUF86 family)
VLDRLGWVDQMVKNIQSLPLENREVFFDDPRNLWAAESCLRRALEALLDLGRHILARGFGIGVSEYKEIASELARQAVLSPQMVNMLSILAGYRNCMVHFYHEITPDEIYDICATQLGDVELIADSFRDWIQQHQDILDRTL